jgi:hypothetical protein
MAAMGGWNVRTGLAIAVLGIAVTAGGAMLAAPAGQGQDRPGQIGQAKVFVENRGKNDAVPVVIQDVMTSTPLGVQVIGTPTVAVSTVVQARLIRQAWDYRTVRVASGQDVMSALSAAGADGWEATGLTPDPAGVTVLLKRPR